MNKRTFRFFFLLSICIWLFPFLIRLFLIDLHNLDPIQTSITSKEPNVISQIEQNLKDGNNLSNFGLLFWNNLKVCIYNIVGGAMLGLMTIINLLINGFFIADIISNAYHNGLPVTYIIKITIPHSFELIGVWISGAIGFSFAKITIDYITKKQVPNKKFIKFLIYNFQFVILIIIIAAYVEAYISIAHL